MRRIIVLIVAVLVLAACSGRKAPNGIELEVLRPGEGDFAKPGEFLVMDMQYKDSKDSVWADTRKMGKPITIRVANALQEKEEKGIESCFRVLKKGDSVRIKVSAKSLFEDTWKMAIPPKVKPEEQITFNLVVSNLVDSVGYAKLQADEQASQMEQMKAQEEEQIASDIIAIDRFLETNKITASKDPSGLRYVVTRKGKGEKPTLASTITINYKGSFLENGQVFDQSREPLEYPLNGFIRGWQIGFPLLAKGSKAVLYIPSSLGYGANGYPPTIPPNANLVFEVELLDFK